MCFNAVAQVWWELPFHLRLPPHGFTCWERVAGFALAYPEPHVGQTTWQRTSELAAREELYAPLPEQDSDAYPQHNYLQRAVRAGGAEITTLRIRRGEEGGFDELRPYSRMLVFIALSNRSDYSEPSTRERAAEAINNLLAVYRFITMDPMTRPLRLDLDHYCTMVSVGDVPEGVDRSDIAAVLQAVPNITFGSTIGLDRIYHVGLNSPDELVGATELPDESQEMLRQLSKSPHRLELWHELFLEAIRRLKRRQAALAVVDAQSAFEAAVAQLVREVLEANGDAALIGERMALGGDLHLLQPRLRFLDGEAEARNGTRFLDSGAEREWRDRLYGVRHEVVHGGRRDVPFDEGKAALAAGLKAVATLHRLCDEYNRQWSWSGGYLDLPHVTDSAGRLFRLFED